MCILSPSAIEWAHAVGYNIDAAIDPAYSEGLFKGTYVQTNTHSNLVLLLDYVHNCAHMLKNGQQRGIYARNLLLLVLRTLTVIQRLLKQL